MSTATVQVFRLPDLGEGLTEAGLVQWLVQVGDEITTDQVIAEVETAKSVVELPSPYAGVVTARHGRPGDTLQVGAPVLEVADRDPLHGVPDASASAPREADPLEAGDLPHEPDAARDEAEKHAYRAEERAGSGNVLIGYGTTQRTSSGRRRPRALASSARDLAERTTPSREQTVHSPTSRAVDAGTAVAVRSPIVRRLARDLGVDVHAITATGADGAVTRADVLRAAVEMGTAAGGEPDARGGAPGRGWASEKGTAPGQSVAPGQSTASGQSVASGSDASDAVHGLAIASLEPLSMTRRAISATLSRSRAEIPEATVWVDVDATELWEARRHMVPAGEQPPSITALVARFSLIALAEFPLLASRLSDDGAQITTFDGVNLGVAADTARGLLVPVIPRAHELALSEIDAQLRELADQARAGTLPAERLRGSTFTLNNYGGFGVDGSAAIINHPEVAILGIGRMIERPWVVEGAIVARRITQLSLVFDHRVCDGGYAAGFLRRVVELIEHPLHAFGRI